MKFLSTLLVIIMGAVNILMAQNANPTITSTKLSDNLYQFFIYVDQDNSVNIYAMIGSDGILLIDSGYRFSTDLIKSELTKISDKKIKYIINTHIDGDHTGGNALLGSEATIISHQHCRDQLIANGRFDGPGLPDITFNDSAKIFFNGEEISLRYFPGHTYTDIVVQFRNANFFFIGDLVFADSFPGVHPYGNIYMYEESLRKFPALFNGDSRIFTGHGRELTKQDFKPYLKMFLTTKDLVLAEIKEGKLPDEVKKNGLLKDFSKWNSKVFPLSLNENGWIDNLYSALDEGKKLSGYNYLKSIFDKSGLEAMLHEFEKLHNAEKPKFYFLENDFNNWGYALLFGQQLNESIEVFIINTKLFPESANTFDSLGEAYMNAGNKELAVNNYEKSLKLNANNQNAVEQLKKLKEM